jgi:hypothetical protein
VSALVDGLAEEAFLVQQPHADQRHREVARPLEEIAGEHAETARVQRQRLREAKLHTEIRHASKRLIGIGLAKPAGLAEIALARVVEAAELIEEPRVGGQLLEALARHVLENGPGVFRSLPDDGVDGTPEAIRRVTPRPTQVTSEVAQTFERGRQRTIQRAAHFPECGSGPPPRSRHDSVR